MIEGDFSESVKWIQLGLRFASPQTSKVFTILNGLNGCAQSQGVYAVRSYRKQSEFWGGAVIIISQNGLNRIPQALGACVLDKLGLGGVTGGGPGGDLTCTDHYQIAAVDDPYYVAMAGVPGDFCPAAASAHSGMQRFQWP